MASLNDLYSEAGLLGQDVSGGGGGGPPSGPAGGDLTGTYPNPALNDVVVTGVTGGTTGFLYRNAAGVVFRRLANLSAAVDPSINADSAAGYSIGSVWINTTADRVWMCVDNSAGSAIWDLITPGTVTTSGSLANYVLCGPVSGAPSLPTFRNLDVADIPLILKRQQEDGNNGPGAVPFPGARVGDVVVDILGWVTGAGTMLNSNIADFESIISVNDQIQQTSMANLSTNTYRFLLQARS
ncbi:MAG: hypothetical protein EKK57_11170 [Proteobacteria bacterium]|nr:MAG: hypothetical protein EKK57_11170 [Pseudomonadota bacterium]